MTRHAWARRYNRNKNKADDGAALPGAKILNREAFEKCKFRNFRLRRVIHIPETPQKMITMTMTSLRNLVMTKKVHPWMILIHQVTLNLFNKFHQQLLTGEPVRQTYHDPDAIEFWPQLNNQKFPLNLQKSLLHMLQIRREQQIRIGQAMPILEYNRKL